MFCKNYVKMYADIQVTATIGGGSSNSHFNANIFQVPHLTPGPSDRRAEESPPEASI